MADCDICGRPAVTRAKVEGALLSVCQSCLRYGREVASRQQAGKQPAIRKPTKEYDLAEGYGKLVMAGREKAGFSRQDLARKLLIFENVLARVEEGRMRPDEALARKLEAALGITLLEEKRPGEGLDGPKLPAASKGRELTLADVVDLKKK